MSTKNYSGKINEVQIGKGEKAVRLGGENTLAFCNFDGDSGNIPKLGIEIIDIFPSGWVDSLKELYKEVASSPAYWAKFVEEKLKPDFICLRFEGADPNGLDKSEEECAKTAKEVAAAISLPLVIAGTSNQDKNAKLFEKISAAIEGSNSLFMSAVEANYKAVGAAAGLAYKHKVSAESSVDLNLAKQLNILLNQLGVSSDDMVMNVGCAAVGYGFEYLITTMERVRLAALDQNDKTLQVPIITPVSFETWGVKESLASEEDFPDWGSREERAIQMEISTAAGILAAGSDAVILRHPKSLETIRELINALH